MNTPANIKVLISGRDVNGSGGGRVLIETALGLARRDCEVVVLSDTSIPELAGKVPVRTTWFGEKLKAWRPTHKASRIARHTLQILCFMALGTWTAASFRKQGYLIVNHNIEILIGDVIVLHNVFSAQAVMERESKMWSLVRFLNPVFTARIVREKWVLGRGEARAVVAVSRPTLEEAASMIKGQRETLVIQNGVDTARFSQGTEMHDADSSASVNEIPLLFVGHEFERKGLRFLIEALTHLPGNVVLWVAGGRGSNVEEYQKFAATLGVSNRVRFLGTVRNPGDLFRQCFAFVLPTAYEALPLVVLEAMACAKPVLATAVGGIVDIIDDGHNGLLIERDAKDIARKVGLLMADTGARRRLGAAAQSTANEHTWDRVTDQYLKVIASVAS
ncbi:MAG TPA: glycosyltransferase family 4 protein [Trinickia sp.]|jgi:glycosyltransferase involved in cell wall biosynthesis|uniref:glycosyltransferase family 4 protein n=1 Tax=Trinickia sp. TaxID=2571163 RepID=UPI002CBE78E5|nr:glycosyltransferase family 4 protein [Trinickia sp.]HTI18895.1 glycosyltransferase family 4 protein [Trinickia sp.]